MSGVRRVRTVAAADAAAGDRPGHQVKVNYFAHYELLKGLVARRMGVLDPREPIVASNGFRFAEGLPAPPDPLTPETLLWHILNVQIPFYAAKLANEGISERQITLYFWPEIEALTHLTRGEPAAARAGYERDQQIETDLGVAPYLALATLMEDLPNE